MVDFSISSVEPSSFAAKDCYSEGVLRFDLIIVLLLGHVEPVSVPCVSNI